MKMQLLYDAFVATRADILFRQFNRAPLVLFYHGVAESPDCMVEQESISAFMFRKQMSYLKKYYNVISPQEFFQRYTENLWDGREVLLTFDDGYKNMLSTALPILSEYDFPFLLFLTTNNVEHEELFATSVNRLVVLASSLSHLTIECCGIDVDLSVTNRSTVAEAISRCLKRVSLSEVK